MIAAPLRPSASGPKVRPVLRPRLLAACVCAALAARGAGAGDGDAPVALIVETKVYTWSDVRRAAGQMGAVDAGRQQEVLERARVRLASEWLLYLYARARGIAVGDSEVAERVGRQMRQSADGAQFLAGLELQGVRTYKEYQENVRRQLMVQRLMLMLTYGPEFFGPYRDARLATLVRPTEVQREIETHRARYERDVPGGLWFASVSRKAVPDAEAVAREIAAAWQAGGTPATVREALAARGLKAPFVRAEDEGTWTLGADAADTTFDRRVLPALHAAFVALREGETSAPVAELDAWHVLRLVRRHRRELRPRAEIWDEARQVVESETLAERERAALREAVRWIHVWPPEVRAAIASK